MRIDPNYIVFAGHTDWYTFENGIGYLPTNEAPEEAVKAMKKFNSYTYEQKYKPLCEILDITVNELFAGERISSETENEAKDYLIDLLISRIYEVDCGVSYEDFKNALLRMSEATVILSKFKSKEATVEYMARETGLACEECSNAYDFYFNLNKVKHV